MAGFTIGSDSVLKSCFGRLRSLKSSAHVDPVHMGRRRVLGSLFPLLIPFAFDGLGSALEAISRTDDAGLSPEHIRIRPQFVDISESRGLNFQYLASHTPKKYLIETMGSGVALFDYDNDGRLDIFLVNGAPLGESAARGFIPQKSGPPYWNRLFHQKPDGTFEDVTERAGLQGSGYGMGVATGDYDNDGFQDLYVTAYGGNKLYHNNGDGTFTDVTEKAGVGGSGWPTSAAWVDIDNDGRLDLIVLRYMQWDFQDLWCGPTAPPQREYCHPDQFPPATPLVYHNDGDGHFSEVSQEIHISKPGKGLGIAIGDFDRDGYTDVFVANDSMFEFLYRNKRAGTFEEVALPAGVAVDGNGRTFAGMGVDTADYNNDGLPDLLITDLAEQAYALYRNNGDGSFTYVTYASGLGQITMLHSGWGVRFIDFDNDGWKDLLIAQGHDMDTVQREYPNLRYREPMALLRNVGGTFEDVSSDAGAVFQQAWVGRGLAIGDIDNDGRVDAVVATNDGRAHILHNETASPNHWLILELIGHTSNRDAIGAEVTIRTPQGIQFQTVSTAGSYLSSSDKRVHFGLGATAVVAEVKIRWPSGIVQVIRQVAVNRIIKVDEPSRQAPVSPPPSQGSAREEPSGGSSSPKDSAK